MGCDCSRRGPGDSPDNPLLFGAPNGYTVHVDVLIAVAGLRLGEQWVTGADVPDWAAKRFIAIID